MNSGDESTGTDASDCDALAMNVVDILSDAGDDFLLMPTDGHLKDTVVSDLISLLK